VNLGKIRGIPIAGGQEEEEEQADRSVLA